jgi:hypothetical protein
MTRRAMDGVDFGFLRKRVLGVMTLRNKVKVRRTKKRTKRTKRTTRTTRTTKKKVMSELATPSPNRKLDGFR